MKSKIRGYLAGILSGITWGFDTVILGIVMSMTPFVENKILVMGGAIFASALHDVFSACWLCLYMWKKRRLPELIPALKTRDGKFCALAALFGGPIAMTFYTLAIATGGAALTANVTAIYPILGTALAVLILKEKTGIQTWLGLVLCVGGICLMGYAPPGEQSVNIIGGILLAFIAAVGWATEGVVCGYGMKGGRVDPILALLIREITSGLVYCLIVAPIFLKGYASVFAGTRAIFLCPSCALLLSVTALIGMTSFGLWYTAIDNIGAAKGLCLNVTYSLWSVLITLALSLVFPENFIGSLSVYIIVGSLFMVAGVMMATLYHLKDE